MRRKEREITDQRMIESVFSSADVCRVAFASANEPYIVTMNFGYQPGDKSILYFHCAREGKKIDMLGKNNYVCFEVDTDHRLYNGPKGCDWGMSYKSIVGYGYIFVVVDNDERKRALDLIMDHYSGKGVYGYDERIMARTAILRLEISDMTGKQA
jgi:nitroimidazol reductase NimA-like FMN-containing flavoprotein (pyridoxamine 5'-phosphate oxidase superfamily)